MKKPTIVFYPNEAKKSAKTQLIPIYMRVSAQGRKTEARLDVCIKPIEIQYWNKFTQRLDFPNNNVNVILEKIAERFLKTSLVEEENFLNMLPEEVKVDKTVILTPQNGDTDPPQGFNAKNKWRLTILPFFSQCFTFQFDLVRRMYQPVQDSISNGTFTHYIEPACRWQLTGNNEGQKTSDLGSWHIPGHKRV